MTQPQSLFEITGRGFSPARLANAAVVVIDSQEEYRSGVVKLPEIDSSIREIQRLLEAARKTERPIVHVRHLGTPGGMLDPQGPRGMFIAETAPIEGEIIVDKRLPNAFSGTELHERLEKIGHLDLIICGYMTHSSLSSTVRASKDFGYRCTLAYSACATRDLPATDGGVIKAADVHRVVMAALADNFAAVVPDVQSLL